jgi:hypothetical protein
VKNAHAETPEVEDSKAEAVVAVATKAEAAVVAVATNVVMTTVVVVDSNVAMTVAVVVVETTTVVVAVETVGNLKRKTLKKLSANWQMAFFYALKFSIFRRLKT